MGTPCEARSCDTDDFPEAMPPVSPTTEDKVNFLEISAVGMGEGCLT